MPTQTININYTIDCSLLLTAEEIFSFYLVDLPTRGIRGQRMTEDAIEEKVRIATTQLENRLNIRVALQRLFESRDFDRELFSQWGFVKMSYLVNKVFDLRGQIGYSNQVIYPQSWISIKREINKARNVYLVPGQQTDYTGLATQQDFIAVFLSNSYILGYSNVGMIPNYWKVEYQTGFEKVPADVLDAIGKLAAIQILAILGDIKFPVGVGSSSLSIDGLSQSLSTVQSSGKSIYAARITQYGEDLKNMDLPRLDNQYATFGSIAL